MTGFAYGTALGVACGLWAAQFARKVVLARRERAWHARVNAMVKLLADGRTP